MARTPCILAVLAAATAACSTTDRISGPAAAIDDRDRRASLAEVLAAPAPEAELVQAADANAPRILHVDLGSRGVIRDVEFARLSVDATGRTWAAAQYDVGSCWRAADAARADTVRPGAVIDVIAARVDLARLKTCLAENGYAGVLLSKPAHADNGPFGAVRRTPADTVVAAAEPEDDGPRAAAYGAPIKVAATRRAPVSGRALGLRTGDGGALPARAATAPDDIGGGGAAPAWTEAHTARVESAAARTVSATESAARESGGSDIVVDIALTRAVAARAPEPSAYATARRRADLDRMTLLYARGAEFAPVAAAPWSEPLAPTAVAVAAAARPLPPLIEEAAEEAPLDGWPAPEPVRVASAADTVPAAPAPPRVEEASEESPMSEPEPVRTAAVATDAAPVAAEAAEPEAPAPVTVAEAAVAAEPEPAAEAVAEAPKPKTSSLPTLDELLGESPGAPRQRGSVVFIPLGD